MDTADENLEDDFDEYKNKVNCKFNYYSDEDIKNKKLYVNKETVLKDKIQKYTEVEHFSDGTIKYHLILSIKIPMILLMLFVIVCVSYLV